MPPSRRAVLRLSSGVLAAGFAGCVSSSSENTTTRANTPTDASTTKTPLSKDTPATTTEQPVVNPTLAFSAAVLQQASQGGPARFETTIENTGSRAQRIGFGGALLSLSVLLGLGAFVIIPDTRTSARTDAPDEPTNGCWRYPEDGVTGIYGVLTWKTLQPGDEHTEQFSVYTRGEGRPCLPEETFTIREECLFETEYRTMTLRVSLTVDAEKRISVSAFEPVIEGV